MHLSCCAGGATYQTPSGLQQTVRRQCWFFRGVCGVGKRAERSVECVCKLQRGKRANRCEPGHVSVRRKKKKIPPHFLRGFALQTGCCVNYPPLVLNLCLIRVNTRGPACPCRLTMPACSLYCCSATFAERCNKWNKAHVCLQYSQGTAVSVRYPHQLQTSTAAVS